jgi:hypothetical protein
VVVGGSGLDADKERACGQQPGAWGETFCEANYTVSQLHGEPATL